jgi:hypothetical protein
LRETIVDCNRWRELASDNIEGTLPRATAEAIREHTESCASCRSDAAMLSAVSREMNVLPTIDPPLFFRENVMAAIGRQEPRTNFWSRMFGPGSGRAMGEQVVRAGVGALLAGGAAAAVCWTLLLPATLSATRNASVPGAVVAPISALLPGGETTGAAEHASPSLRISRVVTMQPGGAAAYDISFCLVGAEKGMASWRFLGDPHAYTFALTGSEPQSVRIPFSAAAGRPALGLQVHWTASAATHARFLFLPVPNGAPGANERLPAGRQSFGLPDQTLVEAAREVSSRFGTPITLDDVPGDPRVQIIAQDETAAEALTRTLAPLGLKVTESHAGIRIAPAAPTPAP